MSLKQLLFEKGQGWLRWGIEERTAFYWESNACAYAPEWYQVAPPLRRLALYLRQWLQVPRLIAGMPPDEISPERYRFSWAEIRPLWPSDMRDPERAA